MAGRRDAWRRNDERIVIEEDETGKMPNNMSHAKKFSNEKWSFEETELFYHVSTRFSWKVNKLTKIDNWPNWRKL
jgi:hypothetical protein